MVTLILTGLALGSLSDFRFFWAFCPLVTLEGFEGLRAWAILCPVGEVGYSELQILRRDMAENWVARRKACGSPDTSWSSASQTAMRVLCRGRRSSRLNGITHYHKLHSDNSPPWDTISWTVWLSFFDTAGNWSIIVWQISFMYLEQSCWYCRGSQAILISQV